MRDVMDLVDKARDAMTVKRVFGDPYEKNGVTVVPVARLLGSAGGGGGESTDGGPTGSGSGFGLTAQPVGMYVIRDGDVQFRPAIDVNRMILGGQVVAIVALITLRTIFKRRRNKA
jgi:uncharacterized spore protein YtfJ